MLKEIDKAVGSFVTDRLENFSFEYDGYDGKKHTYISYPYHLEGMIVGIPYFAIKKIIKLLTDF